MPQPAAALAPARRAGGVGSLALFLFLSLLFCLAMGQVILFNYDTTVDLWIGWTIGWGVVWIVFALLQIGGGRRATRSSGVPSTPGRCSGRS